MKRTIVIDDVDLENLSDGFHTFKELYAQRCHLFIALMRSHPDISWRARAHDDGKIIPDYFLCGMNLPTGQITYHLPIWMWKLMDGCNIKTHDRAPHWDGHSPVDVLQRIHAWCAIGESNWPAYGGAR